jgi:hypothetical protein
MTKIIVKQQIQKIVVSRTFKGATSVLQSVANNYVKKDQTSPQVMVGTFAFPAVDSLLIETPEVKTDKTTPTDLSITTGAQKTIKLNTTVYDDIIIQAINLRGGVSPPSYVAFQDSIFGVSFVNNQTDIVYGAFELPHTYKEGTDLEVHLHWSPGTTNTGRCDWVMKYSYANMGGTFGAEETITFQQEGSGIVNKGQYVSGNVLIDGTSKSLKIGAIFVFALSRPVGDDFTGHAFLHQVGIHYEIDTMGSRQRAVK